MSPGLILVSAWYVRYCSCPWFLDDLKKFKMNNDKETFPSLEQRDVDWLLWFGCHTAPRYPVVHSLTFLKNSRG